MIAQPLTGDDPVRQEMLDQIRARRAGVHAFIMQLQPRSVRLTNLSIICSVAVAALTAGPAFGGTRFTETLQRVLTLPDDAAVWRILCLGATALSIVAAVATNMFTSHHMADRLSAAEACEAELEGLEALVRFGQLPVKEAVILYQQYLSRIPFIHEQGMSH